MSNARHKPTREQKNIICNADGRVKVVAVPGSGKSTVIKDRIIHILNEKKARLDEILILTFTNQAVWQMKEKLYAAVKEVYNDNIKIDNLPVYTFHSLCNLFIGHNEVFHNMHYTIMNEYGQLRMLEEINEEYQLYDKLSKNTKMDIIRQLGDIKSEADKDIEDYAKYFIGSRYDKELEERIVSEKRLGRQLLYIYIKKQKQHKALEFEDLINIVLYKLREDAAFRKKLQAGYKYIFCDEFQDVNDKQNRLVNYLSAGCNNLMVVGDDDQNVYSWRGANFRFLKEFDGITLSLSENFRCSPEILEVARSIIEHNKDREEKEIRAHRKSSGNRPRYISFATQRAEAEWIAENISRWARKLDKESKEGSCAILVRQRAQSTAIKAALDKNHVKYYEDNNDYIHMRKEYKMFYYYLRMVLYYNQSDDDFVATVNYPNRGFGDKALEKLQSERNLGESLIEALTRKLSEPEESSKPKNIRLKKYCSNILRLHNGVKNGEYDCMYVIDELYRMVFGEQPVCAGKEKDDLSFVITKKLKKRISDRTTLLKEIVERYDYFITNNSESRVCITTAHGSKGLEYDKVFIPGMVDGCFPPYSAHTESQYEEERRLLYVAVTRAKNELYISSYREADKAINIRSSPLLGDITPALMEQEYRVEDI